MLMMPREIKRKSKLSRKNIISNIFWIDEVAKTAYNRRKNVITWFVGNNIQKQKTFLAFNLSEELFNLFILNSVTRNIYMFVKHKNIT